MKWTLEKNGLRALASALIYVGGPATNDDHDDQ